MLSPRRLLALALTSLAMTPGCALDDLELGAPTLEVGLELKPEYQIGECVVASLTITNRGENKISIPMQSKMTTNLYKRPAGSSESLHLEFVDDPFDTPDFIDLAPGEEITRKLALPLATRDAGDYEFFAVYRSEIEDDLEGSVTESSQPIPVKIVPPTMFERDGTGKLTEFDAERVAIEHFGQPHASVATKLIIDSNFQMPMWLVTVEFNNPDSQGRREASVLINPYTGHPFGETKDSVSG